MHFFKASLITLVYVACVSAAAIGVPAKEAPSVDKADHGILVGIASQVQDKVRDGLKGAGGALKAAGGALGAGGGFAIGIRGGISLGGKGGGLGGIALGGKGGGPGGIALGGKGVGLGGVALGGKGGGLGGKGGLKGKLPLLGGKSLGSSSKRNSVDKSEGA